MEKYPVLLMVESLGFGGCERDAAKIAISLDRTRFEPHVAIFHAGGFRSAELESAGVPILQLPVRSFYRASALRGARELGAYIRRHRIRLAHAFDVPFDIFGTPVARWYKVPVVITSQLSYRDMYPRERRIALRFTDYLADRVVVNSRAVGESLRRESGFPAEKLYLCYNGVDRREFYPGPEDRCLAFDDASLVVGSVCVLRPEKRVNWVMEAFAKVYPLNPRLRLLLVGSGPEEANLIALRDRLGLQDVCRFMPAQASVGAWMRGIDVYVNSSTSESFPNALLEAMACGCCAIGSNVGGIPELITHREDGLVFDSGDAGQLTEMLRLAVGDRELRESLRRKAVRTAHNRFSIQITLDRTQALYGSLLARAGIC